jgi:serine/threonine-protein kinase
MTESAGAPAEVPTHVTLTVTAGPHTGRVFRFDEHQTFIVGRSRRTHFPLPEKDPYFSRYHFMVEANGPHCRLTDLCSRNGTFVNGRQVRTADLHDGDLIQAGDTVLGVSLLPDASVRTPPEGRTPPTPLAPTLHLPAAVALAGLAAEPSREGATDEVRSVEWTLLPPGSGRGPATPAPAAPPSADSCRVCARPVERSDRTQAAGPPLCPACRADVRGMPQPIAGYQLVRELGRGGMGIVYLALRSADGAVVALKTIAPAVDPSPGDVQRFLREAEVLRRLDHPNIVAFRDMGESNGVLYFATDYVPGTDALRLLADQGPLPIRRAVGLVCQLLQALEYAHGRGLVHRDVKPANLLVTEAAGREVAKLADFGLARVYESSRLSGLTLKGDVGGTVPYLAPEQILDLRGARPPADQYSAAATLYHLLTDRFVYDLPQGDFPNQLLMVLQSPPVDVRSRRADVPEALARAIHRGLAKEPERRFADVTALREALLPFSPQ